LTGPAAQEAWLARRLEQGAKLGACRIVDEGPLQFEKRSEGAAIQVRSALFEGVLAVLDPGALLETIRQGVGPAKAFGFGLLSLGPA
jgi:CRISPR system Cascade subunit CasE